MRIELILVSNDQRDQLVKHSSNLDFWFVMSECEISKGEGEGVKSNFEIRHKKKRKKLN